MVTTASMAQVAALVGEPARASMLQALMDGRALTATELAGVAGVAPQTRAGTSRSSRQPASSRSLARIGTGITGSRHRWWHGCSKA